MELHSLQYVTVLVAELCVERIEHRLIHRQDFIAVVTEGGIHVDIELASLIESICSQVDFPSRIAHTAHIIGG